MKAFAMPTPLFCDRGQQGSPLQSPGPRPAWGGGDGRGGEGVGGGSLPSHSLHRCSGYERESHWLFQGALSPQPLACW